MTKFTMELKHRELLEKIMAWYWDVGKDHISKMDYEFIYDIYTHDITIYGSDVQTRLNAIRDVYAKYLNDNE